MATLTANYTSIRGLEASVYSSLGSILAKPAPVPVPPAPSTPVVPPRPLRPTLKRPLTAPAVPPKPKRVTFAAPPKPTKKSAPAVPPKPTGPPPKAPCSPVIVAKPLPSASVDPFGLTLEEFANLPLALSASDDDTDSDTASIISTISTDSSSSPVIVTKPLSPTPVDFSDLTPEEFINLPLDALFPNNDSGSNTDSTTSTVSTTPDPSTIGVPDDLNWVGTPFAVAPKNASKNDPPEVCLWDHGVRLPTVIKGIQFVDYVIKRYGHIYPEERGNCCFWAALQNVLYVQAPTEATKILYEIFNDPIFQRVFEDWYAGQNAFERTNPKDSSKGPNSLWFLEGEPAEINPFRPAINVLERILTEYNISLRTHTKSPANGEIKLTRGHTDVKSRSVERGTIFQDVSVLNPSGIIYLDILQGGLHYYSLTGTENLVYTRA